MDEKLDKFEKSRKLKIALEIGQNRENWRLDWKLDKIKKSRKLKIRRVSKIAKIRKVKKSPNVNIGLKIGQDKKIVKIED